MFSISYIYYFKSTSHTKWLVLPRWPAESFSAEFLGRIKLKKQKLQASWLFTQRSWVEVISSSIKMEELKKECFLWGFLENHLLFLSWCLWIPIFFTVIFFQMNPSSAVPYYLHFLSYLCFNLSMHQDTSRCLLLWNVEHLKHIQFFWSQHHIDFAQNTLLFFKYSACSV